MALEQELPGAFDEAMADAGTTIELDLPGLRERSINEQELVHITQPVLNVLGGESEAL